MVKKINNYIVLLAAFLALTQSVHTVCAHVETQISNLNKQLLEACNKKEIDLSLVKHLLQQNADINTQDKNGWAPLMHAIYYFNTEAVAFLLSHPQINPNLTTEVESTPLSLAINNAASNPALSAQMVKLLLSSGVSPNNPEQHLFLLPSMLQQACGVPSKEIVELLLQYGAFVTREDVSTEPDQEIKKVLKAALNNPKLIVLRTLLTQNKDAIKKAIANTSLVELNQSSASFFS